MPERRTNWCTLPTWPSSSRGTSKREHKRFHYETDFYALAATQWAFLLSRGLSTSPALGRRAYILLRRGEYPPRRTFSGLHEVGHILLKQSGIEGEIIRRAENHEEALLYIEGFANLAASLLLMPQPLLYEAHKRHGDSPEAILHLTQNGRASLGAALRRHVYSDPYARRAAFVVSGNYIADAASANLWLPFWRYDRVPEPVDESAGRGAAADRAEADAGNGGVVTCRLETVVNMIKHQLGEVKHV